MGPAWASAGRSSGPERALVHGCHLGREQHLPNPADSTVALAAAEIFTVDAARKSGCHRRQLATGPAWNAASAYLAMASQKERQFLAASAAQQGPRQDTGERTRRYTRQYRGQWDGQYSEPLVNITLRNQQKAHSAPSQARATQLPKQSSATRTTTSPTRAESASRAGKPEATTTSTDKQAPFLKTILKPCRSDTHFSADLCASSQVHLQFDKISCPCPGIAPRAAWVYERSTRSRAPLCRASQLRGFRALSFYNHWTQGTF
jgi:hypothetical protein